MSEKEWTPCGEHDHRWKNLDERHYSCTECGVVGWTRSIVVFGRCRRTTPAVVPYRCRSCHGVTTEPNSPCPSCLEKKTLGEGRGCRTSWHILSPSQQRALLYLKGKGAGSFVPRKKGASSLPPLTARGLVQKVGNSSGQIRWALTVEGERVVEKSSSQ